MACKKEYNNYRQALHLVSLMSIRRQGFTACQHAAVLPVCCVQAFVSFRFAFRFSLARRESFLHVQACLRAFATSSPAVTAASACCQSSRNACKAGGERRLHTCRHTYGVLPDSSHPSSNPQPQPRPVHSIQPTSQLITKENSSTAP